MSAQEMPRVPGHQPTAGPGQGSDTPSALTLASVSRDGRRLLLVDETGREYTVDVETRISGEPAMSQQPTGTQSTAPTRSEVAPLALRPRDIQARIRAGEAADDVAAAAQTTVEKIMVYAGPVLAEREHMTERAQKASVRRADASSANRLLGEAVVARLGGLDVDPETVTWDSWRRNDGRWILTAGFDTPEISGVARFVFDVAGNFVTLEDDEARWLVGDLVVEPEPVRDDLRSVRERRLTPILDEPLPLEPERPVEKVVEPQAVRRPAEPEMTGPIEQAPRRNVAKKRGRASVPSWDEIMFGSND